jgi:glucosamine--fructose-6-phosphate aminotransferase (isomerizing)
LLASILAPDKISRSVLGQVPERWASLIGDSQPTSAQVMPYREVRRALVVGRGVNYPTALETALKLKEMCYVQAEGLSASELLHGPIAIVEAGLPVVLFAPTGPSLQGNQSLAHQLIERGAELVVISQEPEAIAGARLVIRIPPMESEIYSPLFCILPAYLLAARLAVTKGLDPDRPRGLAKVTRTF